MTRMILSIGIPGSGKTTILKKLAEKLGATYMGPDVLREEMRGRVDDHSDDKEIWRTLRARISDNLQSGRPVVFDSTFTRQDRRRIFIEDARKVGASNVEGIFFDVPLEETLRRNASRQKNVAEDFIRMSFERLQANPPSAEDGFDVLVRVDEAGNFSDLIPPSGSNVIDTLSSL